MSSKLLRAIFSAAMLALGLFLLLYAYQGKQSAAIGATFSPMFYPKIILWCWVVLAAAMLAESMFFLKAAPKILINWLPLLGGIVLVGLICGLMPVIGFLPSCFGFMLAFSACLGYRKPVSLVFVCMVFTVGVWYVFNNFLGISLPEMPFFE